MARQHYGVWKAVEEEADELLRLSVEGITKYSEKDDYLSPWKLNMRQEREVLTSSGFPEKHIRSGMFKRAANLTRPETNSRDGIARARSAGYASIKTFVAEYGMQPDGHDEDL
jgi:hypothetical protein